MIKNLRIHGHKLISDTEILNISQITVICGPNNSGKSTSMNALQDDVVREGITLNENNANEIIQRYVQGTIYIQNDELTMSGREFKKIVYKAISSTEILFRDSFSEITNKIKDGCLNSHYLRGYNFDEGRVKTALYSFFQDHEFSYLPPKRNLEAEISTREENHVVSPDGKGLINFLFYAKNKPESNSKHIFFKKISDAFYRISDGYKFDVFLSGNNRLTLQFSPKERLWINTKECGLGLQDLLIILYFSLVDKTDIVCIEEPESHIHPDMQRRLLYFLKEITSKQFFITTHSNVFLNNATTDRVLVTKYKNGEIFLSDATNRASLLDDLGYSVTDNLVSDLVILVEGPTDVPILEEILVKLNLIQKYEIKIWPLGGDIMDQLDLDIFSEHYKIIALLDRDPGSSKVRNRFNKKCQESGIPVHILKRYAIENYFTLDALRAVFKSQISDKIETIKTHQSLENQIGINVKKNNRKIIRKMNIKDIEETDLQEFFEKVKSLLMR